MRKVLIPTDFSDNAKDALAYALDYLHNQKVVLHLVHVIQPMYVDLHENTMIDEVVMKRLRGRAESTMKALKFFSEDYFAKEKLNKIELTTSVIEGSIDAAIKQEVMDKNIDLIVMGTQGSNHNLAEQLFGSTSSRMLQNAPCPIIYIPKDYVYQKIDNVIFSTNLDHGDPYELYRSLKILKAHNPVVRVLYVKKLNQKEPLTSMEDFAKYIVEQSPSTRTIFNIEEGTDVESILAEYGDKYDAEMIIMHKSKKSFLERIFKSSHTKNMVNRLKVPLLIMN